MRNFFFFVIYILAVPVNNVFAQREEFNRLQQKLSTTLSDSVSVYTLTRLSNLSQADNLKQAISFAGQAIKQAYTIQDMYPSLLAEAYIQQASNFYWKSNYDSSLQLYYQAIETVNRYGLKKELSYIYTGIADLYSETGAVDKALQYSTRAMNISLEENDPHQAMYAYHSMAGVYEELNNLAEAERYTRKAQALFVTYKQSDRVATCYMDIARFNVLSGNYGKAIPVLDSAVAIFTSLQERIQIAEADELYGAIYNAQRNFEKAARYYNEALAIYERDTLTKDKYRIYLGLSEQYFLQHNYTKTKQLLTEADNWFARNEEDELQMQSLLFLARTDSAQGITKDAFNYLKQYRELSARINHRKQELQTRQMLIEYDVANKEKENIHLKKQNTLANEEILISSIAGTLLLGAFGVMLFLYLQKKRMNDALVNSQLQTENINRQLQESNHVKNQLFSILAHDLRSPMSNALHLLQMTKKGEMPPEQFAQISDMLETDLVYNNQLLDNMLNWAKGQMDGMVLYQKKIRLEPLITENIRLFDSVIQRKKIQVTLAVAKELEVMADENILRLALRNTISNALKFSTPGGNVTIESTLQASNILLQVKDEGVGMTQQQMDQLFTLQVNSTPGTQRERGVGLGLRITKEMMDHMNTPLWIESVAGAGTTVNMLLQQA